MGVTHKPRLDIQAVRTRASSIAGCQVVNIAAGAAGGSGASNNNVGVFLTGLDQPHNAAALARIHVFCDTGTVAIGRIVRGKYRQVFRYNVSSLDTIEDLLRNPPPLTVIDESLLSSTAAPKSVIGQLELTEVAVAILEGERDRLTTHYETLTGAGGTTSISGSGSANAPLDLTNKQALTPSSPKADSESIGNSHPNNGLSGLEFQFSLPPESMKDVDQCLTDIHSMGKLVRKVATNGRGSVFLYGNGGVAYTPNVPKSLYHRLSQLRHSSYESRPAYVSLGSRDRYFVRFHDNSHAFKGPKGLDKELRKNSKSTPVAVAFGSTYDTFCLVRKDGTVVTGGRGVPAELSAHLQGRSDVQTVTLGPQGEWFCKLRNGTLTWGGIHPELEAAIQDLLQQNHYVRGSSEMCFFFLLGLTHHYNLSHTLLFSICD
jgi:hypothetical protein